MPLLGGGEEPAGGLVEVDVADGAGGGQASRCELRLHVALFGRDFVPFESLPKIGGKIAAAAVKFGQRQNRRHMSALGGPSQISLAARLFFGRP